MRATANSQQKHMRDGQININFWHLKEVRDVSSTTHGLYNTDLPLPCRSGLPRIRKRDEESCPLLCGFTAMLFGYKPSAYEASVKVKLV
jgi:hypothetical protein